VPTSGHHPQHKQPPTHDHYPVHRGVDRVVGTLSGFFTRSSFCRTNGSPALERPYKIAIRV
jgi:hypothetical protein